MKLSLLFSFNTSLAFWQKKGILDREKKIYEELLRTKTFDTIYWFTYGVDDQKFKNLVNQKIIIVPLPKIFNSYPGKIIYSFILPVIHYKIIKTCSFVKTNQNIGGWTAVIIKKILKKKLLARSGYLWSAFEKEKSFKEKIASFTEKKLYKNADVISVASQHDKKTIIKKYKINSAKINVIYNYVDTNIFKPMANIKKNKDIIYAGRISQQKNIKNLITALSKLPYVLDIYGEGELQQELKNYSKKIGAKVNYKGKIDNAFLPVILNQYKLFILPSLYEGMPKSLLEAMACGLPCLGTNVVGINEVIDHKKNGYLVEPDTKSIKNGINILMENIILTKKIGSCARIKIIEYFSLNKIVQEEIEIYKQIT